MEKGTETGKTSVLLKQGRKGGPEREEAEKRELGAPG